MTERVRRRRRKKRGHRSEVAGNPFVFTGARTGTPVVGCIDPGNAFASGQGFENFITADGYLLKDGDKPFRFISFTLTRSCCSGSTRAGAGTARSGRPIH